MAILTKAILSVFFIPILAIGLNLIYMKHLKKVSTPPTDFGTGSMFNNIAPRYDIINRVLALNMDTSWRRVMVNEIIEATLFREGGAREEGKKNILDLATGTADVAILLGQEMTKAIEKKGLENSVEIIGVDPSQNMIGVGREKLAERMLDQFISLEIGDSRDLSKFGESTFDGITMAFGIRNVPADERAVALCEMHRVLKKEVGKLAILEFSEPGPEYGVLGYVARFFIRHVVPSLGALLSGAPKEYIHLQNSIDAFPNWEEFVQLVEGVSCKGGGGSTFRVDKVTQMNFGSVQLYVATPVVSS